MSAMSMIWATVHHCTGVEFVQYQPSNANSIRLIIKRGDNESLELTLFDLPKEVTDAILASALAVKPHPAPKTAEVEVMETCHAGNSDRDL